MSSTCALSGISAPTVVTLAALATGDDAAAVIVSPDCSEVIVQATASEDPSEEMINASYAAIQAVASVPRVANLRLWNNQITALEADADSVKYIDLTSNEISTLDGFRFPSSVQRLILDLNTITTSKTTDFPDALTSLYLRKNDIASLSTLRFPPSLQSLFLSGNTQLQSLSGAVFPDTLVTLDCSTCGVTDISGVVFPSSLSTLTLSGAIVTTLELRESDVAVLKAATVQITASVSSCSTAGAALTTIHDGIQACVITDAMFTSLYPDASGSGSFASSSSSASASSSSSPAPTSDSSTSSSTTTSSSSSKAGVYGGISAGILLVLLVLVLGFFLYRRRQSRRLKATTSTNNASVTYGIPPSTDSKPTSSQPESSTVLESSGFLANDVRLDASLIPFRLPVDELLVSRELARGSFGVVSLATMRHDKRLVVVKRLRDGSSGHTDALRRFMGEIQLCSRLQHPKIVRFIGVAWTTLLDLSLVLEFMPQGDLSGLLKKIQSTGGDLQHTESKTSFSWLDKNSTPRSKVAIALDITEAVVYLHSFSSPVIHRDIKAKNVLLSSTFEAKLSDFGVSRERHKPGVDDGSGYSESTMTGGMGTTAWIAPEVLQGDRYSEKADLFSLGIVLAELDTCGHPYNNVYNDREQQQLTDAKIALLVSSDALKPSLSPECPPGIRDLLLRCVAFDPRERPSAVELHYALRKLQAAASSHH